MTKDDTTPIKALGEILRWSNGYAMSLGMTGSGSSVVRCCAGHESPEEAKSHGLVRLVASASVIADRDIASWSTGAAEIGA